MSTEYFPGQKADEKIEAIVHPHWLNLLGAIVFLLVASVLPMLILIAANVAGLPELSGTSRAVVTAILGGYYATLVTFFFIRWLSVYLGVGVVTDQRVVDVDQRRLFSRNVAELDCKMVQDVSEDKAGFLRTIFDFGDVVIQTAGDRANFTFEGVPHPGRVVDIIQRSVAGRTEESDAVAEEAAETMQEAAEKMKEAAETITEQPAAENGHPTPEAVKKTESARSASSPPPTPKEPTAPADSPPSEPSQPPKPTSQPPDELQDLPKDYEK